MYVSIHAKHSIKTQKWKLANYFSGNPLKQLPTHVLGDKATLHKTAVLGCPIIAREAKTPSRGGFYLHLISSFNSAIKGGFNFHFSKQLPPILRTNLKTEISNDFPQCPPRRGSPPEYYGYWTFLPLHSLPVQSSPLLTNHIHAETHGFPWFF